MGIAAVIVLYWRLIRRYHQMQLRHIISELHYIANGHFDHRISFSVNNDMQKVIDSINSWSTQPWGRSMKKRRSSSRKTN